MASYPLAYYYNLYVNLTVQANNQYGGGTTVCSPSQFGYSASVSCYTNVAQNCYNPISLALSTYNGVATNNYQDPYGVSLIRVPQYAAGGQSWTAPGTSLSGVGYWAFFTQTQEGVGSTCAGLPQGESSSYGGWGTGVNQYMGQFIGYLQPFSNSYDGKYVVENYGPTADTCYFPGSAYAPLGSVYAGGNWPVGASQYYYDDIGMVDNYGIDQGSWIRYYQGLGLTCGWNAQQTMSIGPQSGPFTPYNSHWVGFVLYGHPSNPNVNTISAFRDTAGGSISWQ
jgi:hypothetical protein